jgi:hypothetical protein
MSMTSLITEMHTLRNVLDSHDSNLLIPNKSKNPLKSQEQKGATADKLLAVEIEIGRRVRAFKK